MLHCLVMAFKPTAFDSLLSRAGFETYEGLAVIAGVSRHTLWRWRRGKPPKRKSALVTIVAEALNTTPENLLGAFAPRPRRR